MTAQQRLFDEPVELLMSLDSRFLAPILSGEKPYEFRKRYPQHPTIAYIYVKRPVAAVAVRLRLGAPIAEPKALAGQHGLGVDDFVAGRKPGRVALPILDITLLDPPVRLTELRDTFRLRPPQSYLYLDKRPRLLALLRARAQNQP